MPRVPVLFYLRKDTSAHILDSLTRAERRSCETPFSIDPNACGDLFEPAGISPQAWMTFVREKYDVDLAMPDARKIATALEGLTEGYVNREVRIACENAEIWDGTDEELSATAWELEDDASQVVSCESMWSIIGGTLGKGLSCIAFMADPDDLRAALSDDNEITIAVDPTDGRGAFFGLYDAANGSGTMEFATGSITIRPSVRGTMIVGTEEILDLFGMDVQAMPETKITHVLGEPLRVSSRTMETMRFGAPNVDLSALDKDTGPRV